MKQNKTRQADFGDWVDMWEKAQTDGVFKDAPKPPRPAGSLDFFGQYPTLDTDIPADAPDTEYWRQVYDRSVDSGDAPDLAAPSVFTEQKKPEKSKKPVEKPSKSRSTPPRKKRKKSKQLREFAGDEVKGRDPELAKKVVGAAARSPNPIYYYSAGKDQDLHVTPNWSDGKELVELHDLKIKLHQLEGKLNAMIGVGKPDTQVKKLEQELRTLRDRLDDLSDNLHGGWAGEQRD